MKKTEQSKANEISKLFRAYCKNHLDDEYLRLCNNLFIDLLELDQDVFKRGKESIWAASIVWAIGSVNFLGDKYFEPYASLSDVCSYFNANTSTVGQKASMIREGLDIDFFNSNYQREDSQISVFLNNLVMTEDGLIVPRDLLEEDEEEELIETYVQEEPDYYIILLESQFPVKSTDIYQLEHLFKTILDEGEKLQKVKITEKKALHIYFYGRPAKILKFEKKLSSGKFTITDVVNQPVS
ncbi:MAG: DUF6398 domain-containing protein [Bacteroidales bacterium]|nr:DUF6398 domain-containing protein [Bacteroidales bacterium]